MQNNEKERKKKTTETMMKNFANNRLKQTKHFESQRNGATKRTGRKFR